MCCCLPLRPAATLCRKNVHAFITACTFWSIMCVHLWFVKASAGQKICEACGGVVKSLFLCICVCMCPWGCLFIVLVFASALTPILVLWPCSHIINPLLKCMLRNERRSRHILTLKFPLLEFSTILSLALSDRDKSLKVNCFLEVVWG